MSDQKFELWEGRKATFDGDSGKFVQWGGEDYWSLIPESSECMMTEASSGFWLGKFEQGRLAFVDEFPDYERVEVKHWQELLIGDMFIDVDGGRQIVDDIECLYSRGFVDALGYVWRPKGEK